MLTDITSLLRSAMGSRGDEPAASKPRTGFFHALLSSLTATRSKAEGTGNHGATDRTRHEHPAEFSPTAEPASDRTGAQIQNTQPDVTQHSPSLPWHGITAPQPVPPNGLGGGALGDAHEAATDAQAAPATEPATEPATRPVSESAAEPAANQVPTTAANVPSLPFTNVAPNATPNAAPGATPNLTPGTTPNLTPNLTANPFVNPSAKTIVNPQTTDRATAPTTNAGPSPGRLQMGATDRPPVAPRRMGTSTSWRSYRTFPAADPRPNPAPQGATDRPEPGTLRNRPVSAPSIDPSRAGLERDVLGPLERANTPRPASERGELAQNEPPSQAAKTEGPAARGIAVEYTESDGAPTGKAVHASSEDGRPADGKPNDGQPADVKPADLRTADGRTVDARPVDARPVDARPVDTRPADGGRRDGTHPSRPLPLAAEHALNDSATVEKLVTSNEGDAHPVPELESTPDSAPNSSRPVSELESLRNALRMGSSAERAEFDAAPRRPAAMFHNDVNQKRAALTSADAQDTLPLVEKTAIPASETRQALPDRQISVQPGSAFAPESGPAVVKDAKHVVPTTYPQEETIRATIRRVEVGTVSRPTDTRTALDWTRLRTASRIAFESQNQPTLTPTSTSLADGVVAPPDATAATDVRESPESFQSPGVGREAADHVQRHKPVAPEANTPGKRQAPGAGAGPEPRGTPERLRPIEPADAKVHRQSAVLREAVAPSDTSVHKGIDGTQPDRAQKVSTGASAATEPDQPEIRVQPETSARRGTRTNAETPQSRNTHADGGAVMTEGNDDFPQARNDRATESGRPTGNRETASDGQTHRPAGAPGNPDIRPGSSWDTPPKAGGSDVVQEPDERPVISARPEPATVTDEKMDANTPLKPETVVRPDLVPARSEVRTERSNDNSGEGTQLAETDSAPVARADRGAGTSGHDRNDRGRNDRDRNERGARPIESGARLEQRAAVDDQLVATRLGLQLTDDLVGNVADAIETLLGSDSSTMTPDGVRAQNSLSRGTTNTPTSRPSGTWYQPSAGIRLPDGSGPAGAAGWHAIEMNLEDGDGSLLIRARKDTDITRISLEFTDPALKVHAEQNADRIRAVLAERYDTEIDLNLGGRESDGSRNDSGDRETGRPRSVDAAHRRSPDASAQATPTTATETRGLSNEWIG